MRLLSYSDKTLSVQAGGRVCTDVQRHMKDVPMRKMLISIAAPLLLVAALPAAAQDQNQPRARDNNEAGQQTNANPERKICVNVELTGSRMNRRICRTAREWEERGGLEAAR